MERCSIWVWVKQQAKIKSIARVILVRLLMNTIEPKSSSLLGRAKILACFLEFKDFVMCISFVHLLHISRHNLRHKHRDINTFPLRCCQYLLPSRKHKCDEHVVSWCCSLLWDAGPNPCLPTYGSICWVSGNTFLSCWLLFQNNLFKSNYQTLTEFKSSYR